MKRTPIRRNTPLSRRNGPSTAKRVAGGTAVPRKRQNRSQAKSRQFRDGRIVLSKSDWRKLREWFWFDRWDLLESMPWPPCALCFQTIQWFREFTLDHITPRGMGGGKRDDRFVQPAHFWCNAKKGSKRLN